MKYYVFLALLLAGCGGPGAKSPDARALARSGVDLAKDAWVLVAHACIDVSAQMNDDSIRTKCADYLRPAHTLILTAAEAVDTEWTAPVACELARATVLVSEASAGLGQVSLAIKPTVDDAMAIARGLAGAVCAADGSAE